MVKSGVVTAVKTAAVLARGAVIVGGMIAGVATLGIPPSLFCESGAEYFNETGGRYLF